MVCAGVHNTAQEPFSASNCYGRKCVGFVRKIATPQQPFCVAVNDVKHLTRV